MKNKKNILDIVQNNNLYRCYSHEKSKEEDVCSNSIFELIGKKEPDQTKTLGYVLARSKVAMKGFLLLILKNEKNVDNLLEGDYIVDCELQIEDGNGNPYRADIVISFPNSKNKYSILVEAKSLSSYISEQGAVTQTSKYLESSFFKDKNVQRVTLTTYKEYGNRKDENIINLVWTDIVDMFYKILQTTKDDYSSLWLIKDYFNYISKIKQLMKYYDIEVLSVPAGGTFNLVKDYGIYECPTTSNYKKRMNHKPLYMAFRASQGEVTTLYKISDVIEMHIMGDESKTYIENLPDEYRGRIEGYVGELKKRINGEDNGKGLKYVFFINRDESIELPYTIKYKKNNSFMETSKKLCDYFKRPKEGEIYIYF